MFKLERQHLVHEHRQRRSVRRDRADRDDQSGQQPAGSDERLTDRLRRGIQRAGDRVHEQ